MQTLHYTSGNFHFVHTCVRMYIALMELFELANERMELDICQFSKKNSWEIGTQVGGGGHPRGSPPCMSGVNI